MPESANSSPAVLAAQRVSKHRGLARILVEVDLVVGPQTRIGVVGPNGVGKTTLLRILAGLETPDSGRVTLSPPEATVGYLAQETETEGEETFRQMLRRRTGVAAAEASLEATAHDLAARARGADERYDAALQRYLGLGGPDIEERMATALAELGVPDHLLELPVARLSGGQRARASLAALLLSRFELLLLDEPTNDLDLDALGRLEVFLEHRANGLVVVSHDRAFLERIVTTVVEIDEWTHRASEFGGGWTAYVEAKETDRRHAAQAYERYLGENERLKSRAHEQRQWSLQGVGKEKKQPRDNDKAQRDFRVNRTEKQASKVRATEKALERLEVVERPYVPWQLHLDLASTNRSGDVVARLAGAVVRRGDWILGPVDLELAWSDRVALLGPNGSGKTTLLSVLLGRTPLDSGTRWLGPSVVVGELGQERLRFSPAGETLLRGFLAAAPLTAAEARALLAKFGLGAEHVLREAASLSPGERTRAELALLMARGVNCLVLDEPTNHLDLPAIEQLEQALEAWQGTLLLVTHDRRLLEHVRLSLCVELQDGKVAAVRP